MVMVAICDDDATIGAELERALIDILGKMKIEHSVDVFFSGEELCHHMETGVHYDLIFLDIEFAQHEINGVEVGRLIREAQQNDFVSIVYMSRVKDYAFELFEVRPLNFLIKPLEQDIIERTVRTYLKIARLWSEEFSYCIGRDTFKVKVKDIIYLESRDKKLILNFADGSMVEFYGAIREIYHEQLKKFDFLFIHAAYAVNFDYISAIRYDRVFLADSVTPIPISQGRRNEIREKYCEIMKRRRV
ncbi:MAG: LytTR family DNA-binding domain-containing protein [Oscillospiraceae bacterium]|jgi:DNA-binding LytR/AlgR family response regulator|nr:LytTR family DNA-binding domain-containing protein [Oscillospiraceae bacterium]